MRSIQHLWLVSLAAGVFLSGCEGGSSQGQFFLHAKGAHESIVRQEHRPAAEDRPGRPQSWKYSILAPSALRRSARSS